MILIDTSGLLAALDESQRHHQVCAEALTSSLPPLLLSPFVLAELDYLLMRYLGPHAQSAFLAEVVSGAYQLELFSAADVLRASEVIDRYADLQIGLADASLVVLAERHAVVDVLTLDEKHFRSMRIEKRKRFRILPFDK